MLNEMQVVKDKIINENVVKDFRFVLENKLNINLLCDVAVTVVVATNAVTVKVQLYYCTWFPVLYHQIR